MKLTSEIHKPKEPESKGLVALVDVECPGPKLHQSGSPLPSIPGRPLSLSPTGTATAHSCGAFVWAKHVCFARKVLLLSSRNHQLLLFSPSKVSRFGCYSKVVSGR